MYSVWVREVYEVRGIESDLVKIEEVVKALHKKCGCY